MVNKGQHRSGTVSTVPTPEQQKAFGDALRSLLESHKHTQRQFGEAIGELIRGADKPYAQSTVRDWIEKAAPAPEIVFEMEGYLLVPPGTLSQHLGYLPLGARSIETVEEALMSDTSISSGGRDLVLILYAILAGQPLTYATLDVITLGSLRTILDSASDPGWPENPERIRYDDKGRMIQGFDRASLSELLKAFNDWAEVPQLPIPRALVGALHQRRAEIASSSWTQPETLEAIDAAIENYSNAWHSHNEQYAQAAEGGATESQTGTVNKPPATGGFDPDED